MVHNQVDHSPTVKKKQRIGFWRVNATNVLSHMLIQSPLSHIGDNGESQWRRRPPTTWCQCGYQRLMTSEWWLNICSTTPSIKPAPHHPSAAGETLWIYSSWSYSYVHRYPFLHLSDRVLHLWPITDMPLSPYSQSDTTATTGTTTIIPLSEIQKTDWPGSRTTTIHFFDRRANTTAWSKTMTKLSFTPPIYHIIKCSNFIHTLLSSLSLLFTPSEKTETKTRASR